MGGLMQEAPERVAVLDIDPVDELRDDVPAL
jgi:hypothetical protein